MTDRIPSLVFVRTPWVAWFFFVAGLGCISTITAQSSIQEIADKIVVHKKEHTLELLREGATIREYKVALGTEPVGPKTRQGDHKTPEGIYIIDRRNEHSHFYRALHISYPNPEDRERAQKIGFAPGGDVMIHGLPNGFGWVGRSHRLKDWTEGCIAVTDEEMDEIWKLVPDGTKIEIKP